MKSLIKGIMLVLTCLLLFQSVIICDVGGSVKAYADAVPLDGAPPPPADVRGNIVTDIDCSEEAKKLINPEFKITGAGLTIMTDESGFFRMMLGYKNVGVFDFTVEKKGFLKRILNDINVQLYTTNIKDILMWAGDLNGDSAINMADCVYLAGRFNSIKGDSLYDADADINKDNAINMSDLVYVAKHFNATSDSYPVYVHTSPTPTPISATLTPTTSVSPTPTQIITPTPTPEKTGLEIERKFLLDPSKIPYDLKTLDKYELTQAYISFSPEIRIRNADDWMYFLTVKAYVDQFGMVREEREFWITEQEYNALMKKIEGNIIYKTRYQGLDEKGVMFAIDIFKGNLAGLAYYEVEFPNEEAANKYTPPSWVGLDVTNDKRYKNGSLAQYGRP
ncbi:MAG TPA: dockerin type I domain-containing protein [Pseudobacteroides sp.]|uniref:dockerin type I domain-containing protein n=1 Tax=Pseudobacteroides sp. TaxID=1968840 RepID=UPI002F9553F0